MLKLLFILFPILTYANSDGSNSDKAALQSLHSTLQGHRWNLTGENHCNWQGVTCDSNNRVTELHLPGVGLTGSIPSNVVGNLTSLTFLSLRSNAIVGSIPDDVGKCVQLQYLYLQENELSGDIPRVVFSLRNLVGLSLGGNNLSGGISTGFDNLTNVVSLLLEGNQLSGEIPDLKLPKLKQFNVSNNLLTGSIPSRLCGMPSSAFQGNSLSPCPEKNNTMSEPDRRKKLPVAAIAGIVVGCVVVLLVILLLIFLCCFRRNKRSESSPTSISNDNASNGVAVYVSKQPEMENPAESEAEKSVTAETKVEKKLVYLGNRVKVFDLDDLLKAASQVLGKGSYGTTYKVWMDDGFEVAVKSLKEIKVSETKFAEKMVEIGKLQHENLVDLKAYHSSPSEKLLVYDYLPKGSLSAHLHGNQGSGRTPLNWETRSAIALGTAKGIAYIHSQNPASSHGNITSSNILLSNSYQPRVSDFGLHHIAAPSGPPTRIARYRAPEVTDPCKVSQKADVYSFGIVLLELLTGMAPTHALMNEQGVNLPQWVQSVIREEWASDVFDMNLVRHQKVEENMVKLLQLALDCASQIPDNRPSMSEVTACIEEICSSSLGSDQENS